MGKSEFLKQLIRQAELEKTTVHLQGIGRVKAKPIKDFQVGERLGFNFGSTAEILKKQIKGKSAKLKIKDTEGNVHDVLKRLNTMWAVG